MGLEIDTACLLLQERVNGNYVPDFKVIHRATSESLRLCDENSCVQESHVLTDYSKQLLHAQ
jgi:hypothetical protein